MKINPNQCALSNLNIIDLIGNIAAMQIADYYNISTEQYCDIW
jgi:hypothetical protein